MKMEIIKNVPESPDTNNAKEKGDELLFNDEIEEDEDLLLRLSDDEEVKQDSSSGQIENQLIGKLDSNEDDCNFNKGINNSPKNRAVLGLAEVTALVDEDSSDNSSLDEKSVSENCNINDEDSTMSGSDRIPPLMHNSPKYWSSNFDKRWNGVNSSRGRHHFPQRNPSEWYNQQYPEKDRFNGRNNYNNQNKHFNQQRSNKGKYNPQFRENRATRHSEKETEKSSNLKATLSDVDSIINDMDKIIQENGDCKELKSKENNSTSSENEKVCKKDSGEESSDKKEADCNSDEEKLTVEKYKDSDNAKHNTKSESEETDCKKDDSSVTKDCDTIVSTLENVKSDPKSESNSVDVENKFSSSVLENPNNITKDLSDFNELSLKKDSAMENNVTTASYDNETLKKTDELDNIPSNQINEPEETKDEDHDSVDLNGDTEDDEKNESEKSMDGIKEQTISTSEGNDVKLNSDIEIKENSSFSINEKSVDISELEINESENKPDATVDDITETIDVEINAKPSNSISIADLKKCDTEESKSSADKDEEGSSKMFPLVIDESSCSQEEKMSLDEDEEESEGSVKQCKQNNVVNSNEKTSSVEINGPEKMTALIEEVDLVDNESETTGSTSDNQTETNSFENKKDANNLLISNNNTSQLVPISTESNKNNEEERTVAIKRRRRRRHNTLDDIIVNELPLENGVRQKRRSARNAEEMIRKEILKDDEEDISSDEPSRMVTINYKKAILHGPPLSPPSLKRTVDDLEDVNDNATIKRLKATTEALTTAAAPLPGKEFVPVAKRDGESSSEVKELVRRISTEDIRGKLKKLTQEEMEALLLQKTIECITIRGEMGKLREQARQSKLNHEATRTKCQQLQKQVEGFEMVLKRINFDKNSNNDKFIPPIKITRSVGLQVNFVAAMKPGISSASNPSKTISTAAGSVSVDTRPNNQSSRKVLKTRSPRRPDLATTNIVQTANPIPVTTTVGGSLTPTAIVMNKTVDMANKRTITLPSSTNIVQLMAGQQSVVVNSSVGGTPNRTATITMQRPNAQQSNKSSSNDLIDLTDEEDKSKSPAVTPITTTISRPRVLQAFPASVALTNTNLRLVQAGNQGSQTTIVNNGSSQRLTTYVMQSGANGMSRQLVLANPNTIRPVTSVTTRNVPTISYKPGVPTITSGGTVRVLTTQTPTANVQVTRHPAPLPDTPVVESNPLWKLSPPAPSLKISKVATGIVLSWNMDLSNNKFAEIVSYQLYAYQEVAGTSPSAALWKKVGDVRALPLPMACTLTQFSEGNNYYFAVRAVDVHSRFGQYSTPGHISL